MSDERQGFEEEAQIPKTCFSIHCKIFHFILLSTFLLINIYGLASRHRHRHSISIEEEAHKKPVVLKQVCVFCGSSAGKRDSYTNAAIDLAHQMALKKLDLVYGGGSIGLMGLVSQTLHHGGGRVLGIMPKPLFGREKTGETVGELRVVSTMHERKAEMFRNCDCFIALPGGYGTMEEVLEIITWAQLGIHTKPVGLLNVDGFYDGLLRFIDRAVDEGFIQPMERHIFVSAPNAKLLLNKLEEYVPVVVSNLKWDSVENEQADAVPPSPPQFTG